MPNQIKNKSKLLENLNEQQEKAVSFGNGPLLIIAGAGTGKTTVLTRRIAWLTEQKMAEPEQILALTFTEKAANEMLERVDQLMPLGYSEMDISTFHAFAQKILSEHALDIGLPGDFKVLTETQAWMLIQRNLDKFDLDYYKPIGNPSKFIHSLLKHFNKAKGEGITPEVYLNYAQELKLSLDQPTLKTKKKKKTSEEKPLEAIDETEIARINEVANAYHVYQKLLLDNSHLDFGDLINYAVKLFKTRPKILKYYQDKYKYVLVDEFQDTDLIQYELVKLLSSPQNNVTVVGDDDQSIYKFRGASISNILKFDKDYPDYKQITLTDNYRTTQNILDMAHAFIKLNDPERLESIQKISKKLVSHSPQAGIIQVLHGDTAQAEASHVADKIVELKAEHDYSLNDFAILVRANDHAEPFLNEFAKRGIPFIYVANRGLYKKPFILDILSYFGLLDNYHETGNMFRVLNLPKFQIDSADLIHINQLAKKKALSLYEVIKQIPASIKVSENSYQKLSSLLQLLDKHANLVRTANITEALVKILDDLDLIRELALDSVANAEKRSLLQQFYGKAVNFETESTDKTVKGFLNYIKMELSAGDTGELAFDPDQGPEAVRVMTIHSAKGLEFECVFVVNMVEQRFPSRERREQIEIPDKLVKEILSEGDVHLMEERRLFYVAMTRAKSHLYLTWAKDYGGSTVKKPSKFLVDIGMEKLPQSEGPKGQVFFHPNPTLPLNPPNKFPIPENFSWSSISAFRKCPLEYKYRYLFSLPLPGNGYTSFGSSIHKAIQLFSQQIIQTNSTKQADLFGSKPTDAVKYPTIDNLYKFYDENWIDDWYESRVEKERFKKRGYRLLDNYYAHLLEKQIRPAETEKFFKLKLGDYKYVGVIDCLYQNPDGSVNIVDYKTSKKARTKLEKVDKKQLLAYQWAATEFLRKQVKGLSYWDLEDLSGVIEFLGTKDEIEDIKKEFLADIENIVEAIKSDSFFDLDKKLSHDCEFRDFEPR